MQSSTLFRVVIFCVLAFGLFSFVGVDKSLSINTFPKGHLVTKEIQLEDFHSIALGLAGNVTIKEGTSNTVKISAPEKQINLINTKVKNGLWKVNFTKKTSFNWFNNESIKIEVEMDDIRKLSVGGSGDIETVHLFKDLADVKCAISGSGEIILRGEMNDLDASISGSGTFKVYGVGNTCDLSVSGSGEFEAYEFAVKDADISVSGSGDIYINASDNLNARVSGSGDITYKGNPVINSKVSGSGDISAAR